MTRADARELARQAGEKGYWTGKHCRRGHWSPRYVSNGMCVECCTGKYKIRFPSGYTATLIPHMPVGLFKPVSIPPEFLPGLDLYLQACIYKFAETNGFAWEPLKTFRLLFSQPHYCHGEINGRKLWWAVHTPRQQLIIKEDNKERPLLAEDALPDNVPWIVHEELGVVVYDSENKIFFTVTNDPNEAKRMVGNEY